MLFGIFKLISRYSGKKEFYSILFYLLLSTILQYLLYIILPVLAFKLTSISLNNSENILNTNTNLKYFSEYFNFDLEKILYVTILLAISANIFSLYFIKKSALFSYKISSNIQISVFKNYLYKKYSYFLNNAKSSSLNNIITYNKEREEKENLFKTKVEELKSLFEKENISHLRGLKFDVEDLNLTQLSNGEENT